jgi:signal transduction histidine kinase
VNPIAAELVADPDRMHQLLTNLLTNAVKFSEAGGRVRLAASSTGSDIIFEVADEGRGIPRSQLDLVFDRFHQVDASDSRKKGGTGLGLTICRAIVQQHGGRIIATSPGLGKGSTFIVQLPTNVSVSSPAVGILR